MPSLKCLFATGLVATLASFADAHSALLANSKLLGKLNSGECFNCAVGQYPVPSTIPASAVDASDPADGVAAWIKSSGSTVKDTWAAFHAGTPYGDPVEPEAIKSATCGRYDPTAVGDVPSDAKISYKKSNHNGPGEVWVDGKKTWYGDNFITDGGSLTADAFKCDKATCQVTWYWLGKVKVKNQWNYYQLYVQCFTVKGSSNGSSVPDTPDASASTTATPPATAAAQPISPPAPAEDDGDATPGTVSPPADNASSDNSADTKEARKAAKEKRKAEKAAAKAAKQTAKDAQNLRSE